MLQNIYMAVHYLSKSKHIKQHYIFSVYLTMAIFWMFFLYQVLLDFRVTHVFLTTSLCHRHYYSILQMGKLRQEVSGSSQKAYKSEVKESGFKSRQPGPPKIKNNNNTQSCKDSCHILNDFILEKGIDFRVGEWS